MENEVPEISLNAIYGAKAPQTVRIQGSSGQQRVTFLIDSGSTHNFFNNAIAQKIGLNSSNKGKFEVVWLSTLDPITWDFSKLRMAFTLNGKEVSLQGLKSADNNVVHMDEISKDIKKRGEGMLLQIY
ncbi:hypothetical protein AMTRI_Chr02g260520 [Amborella trichopoda]